MTKELSKKSSQEITQPEKKKRGRPTDFTQSLVDEICNRLATGESLRSVCRDEKMPCGQTIFNWFRTQKGFVEQYARAKQESADALAEEIVDIADDSLKESKTGDAKRAGAKVQAMRLRVDTRKWIMSKMKPKKYGDKLDLTSDGKVLPSPILGNVIQSNNSNKKDSSAG